MLCTEYIRPGEVYDLAQRLGSWRRAYLFVRDHVRYRRERVDRWSTPKETLARMEGDCEDKAILLTSLLKALGHDAWVRVARVRGVGGETVDHAYVLLRMGPGWLTLDPACRDCPPGRLGFTLVKAYMDFNDKVIIVHDPRGAEKYISR